ncbi:MAG: hypothetical protein HRS50_02355, partial [Mycoplasmataceae bacterium]|nr:hypothetical protein [Mycoplasmataceae bacterium]
WIFVTYQGYIKKISQKSKNTSNENTFGKREDDIIISLTQSSNLKNLVLFSSQGRYFSIPIYKLSDYKYRDIGEHISKFTSLDALDRIVGIAIVENFDKDGEIIFSTEKGMVKRSIIKDMNITQTKKGNKFMNIKDGDSVVSVSLLINDDSFVTTVTEKGYAVKYIAGNISTTGLSSSGVRNINITDGDKVVSTMVNFIKDVDNGESQLIFVTHNGKAKRLRTKDIKLSSRGSKGTLIATKTKSTPYKVINVFNVEITDNIHILTDSNEDINLKPKGDLLITDPSSGLTKLTNSGIKFSFNNLSLNIDNLKIINKSKEQEENKSIQLDLETILDEF